MVAEKQGLALARVAKEPEMFTVWAKDGSCEGTETAMPGQVIMTRANDDGTPYIDGYGHANIWCCNMDTFEKNMTLSIRIRRPGSISPPEVPSAS